MRDRRDMTGSTEPLAVHLPESALARLDVLAAAEGGTRDGVARRLLLDALGHRDTAPMQEAEANSLLDVGEDLAGP
jgi:hypothetical protein